MYICKRCGYSTGIKCNLKSHLSRKKVCPNTYSNIEVSVLLNDLKKSTSKLTPIDSKLTPIDSKLTPIDSKLTPIEISKKYICKYCKKEYSKSCNLTRHMKKCAEAQQANTKLELIEYKKELSDMKKQIEKLLINVNYNNNSNNTSNNNSNNTNNITINNYGKENMEYITQDYLTSLFKIPYSSIQHLVKSIHFNPLHPENQNIKIPSRKEKFAKVYNSGNWELKNKKEVIESIVDNSYNIIECHYDDIKDYLEENKKCKFLLFKDNYEDDGLTKKNVEADTELIILNNSKK